VKRQRNEQKAKSKKQKAKSKKQRSFGVPLAAPC